LGRLRWVDDFVFLFRFIRQPADSFYFIKKDQRGSVGFALDNDDGKALAEFYFVGGDTNYLINDKIASRPTGIPWTSSGQFCAFQLQGTTQYLLTAGSSVFTGTLAQLCNASLPSACGT